MRRTAFAALLLILGGAAFADAAPAAQPGCGAPEYRQFDFMIGEWVVGPTGKPETPAKARWDAQGKGCSIIENWLPKSGANGNSINYFDAADQKWHQLWVGADGNAVHYMGAWTGKTLELRAEDITTPQMTKVVLTMTFEPLADGSVRQSGTRSEDGGKSFHPSFDLTYRKAK